MLGLWQVFVSHARKKAEVKQTLITGLVGVKFFWLFLFVFGVDRLTKVAALFLFQKPMDLIQDILSLHLYLHVKQFFFSGFFGFMLSVFLVVCLGCIFFYSNRRGHSAGVRLGATLIGAGALSNVVDVFRYGAVIDFIEVRGLSFFNLSDAAIAIGCALLVYVTLFKKSAV